MLIDNSNMDISLINSQSLLHLLSLTEKKEELLQTVDQIDAEILRALKGGIAVNVFEVASAPAIVPTALKPTAKKAPAAKSAKKARGGKPAGLKERILALLETAGAQGLRVKDIASKLGTKTGSISVWFSTTGKNLVTKVSPGRYAVKGAKPVAIVSMNEATPVKALASAKPDKAKNGISLAGRAKLAAAAKARWAAFRAAKTAAGPANQKKPAKTPQKA